jgi:hypothetical protein
MKGTLHFYNGIIWEQVHPKANFDQLGFIPSFLDASNPLPAAQQIDRAYSHGGGWRPFFGFKLMEGGELKYPEDPPIRCLWRTQLRDETIHFYQHSWLRITQPDSSWQVCRID